MKIKHIIGIILLATAIWSCEDVLDTKTTWYVGDSDVWRIPELAEGVLLKAYNGIPNRPDRYDENFLDCATDNAVTSSWSSSVYKAAMGGITAYNNPLGNWSDSYNMIQYINSFLENGLTDNILYNRVDEDIDQQIKTRLRGEAYFLRAWWHFGLLQVYGGKSVTGKALGIPVLDYYVTQDEASDFSKFKRATYAETVDFIIKDLDNAMEILPQQYEGTDINFGETHTGRATIPAAAVLKSRVLLYSASPAMQDDDVTKITGMGTFQIVNEEAYRSKWEKVALEINEILNMDGFGTFAAVKSTDLADASADNPADFVFRKYFNGNGLETLHFPPYYYGNANTIPSHNLVKAFNTKDGYPVNDPRSGISAQDLQPNMENLYQALDNRFILNIYYHGRIFGNSGVALDMSTGGKDSPDYNERGTRTGYYLSKFVSTNSQMLEPTQMTNAVHYNPLLRKSEVFLNFAEAANEAWNNPTTVGQGCSYSAYEIIKDVRAKSGGISNDLYIDEVATDRDSFRKLIQNERRLEFSFENQRYFDMRRWILPLNEDILGVSITRQSDGTFLYEEKVVEERKYEVKHYFAPLPYDELIKNQNLINNQGWE